MKKLKSAPGVFVLLLICALSAAVLVHMGVRGYKRSRTFGLVCMTMNNEFYEVIHSELYAAVTSQGDTLITLDPQLNLEKQIDQMYWLIDQKVDGLFINPMDSSAIAGPVEKAWEKGIPVVILDAPLSDETRAIATIASDNWQAGEICAEHMVRSLSSAKIALLEHAEVESAKERIDAFKAYIADKPEYEIVAAQDCYGQLELAMPAVERMLQEHPEVQVIMALNDPSAMGALAALESLGREDILVYGVDGTPDVKKQLAAGSSMAATAAQSPITMAHQAADSMYQWLEEGTCEQEQVLEVYLISKDNIGEYSLTGWQ